MLPGFTIELTTKTTYRGTFTGWWILRVGSPIIVDEPFETLLEAMQCMCETDIKCYWCGATKSDCENFSFSKCCDGDRDIR